MSQKPRILSKTTLATSRLFHIQGLAIEFSNGAKRHYERLIKTNGHGAVIIVPMLDRETVLLVREYAAGLERYELGLPKGKLDPGEDSLMAANRELKEEAGFGAGSLTYLATLSLSPSYMEHCIDVVIAENLYPEKLIGDEPEELEILPWKINDIVGLTANGECSEARSIAALYMTAEYLNRRLP